MPRSVEKEDAQASSSQKSTGRLKASKDGLSELFTVRKPASSVAKNTAVPIRLIRNPGNRKSPVTAL